MSSDSAALVLWPLLVRLIHPSLPCLRVVIAPPPKHRVFISPRTKQIHEFVTLNALPGKLPKKKNELLNSLRKLQVRSSLLRICIHGLRVVVVCFGGATFG